MSANTPYKSAQGYATRTCWWSIDRAVTKSFDADIAHHIIQKHESAVPIIPLLKMKKKIYIYIYIYK